MATNYDINVDAGADFRLQITYQYNSGTDSAPTWTPFNLTNSFARCQIRADIGFPVLVEVDSQTQGEISLGTTNGVILMQIPAAKTDALNDIKRGKYDLELVFNDTGHVYRVIQGAVVVSQNVTTDDE